MSNQPSIPEHQILDKFSAHPPQLHELIHFAESLADAAAKAILPHFRQSLHVENKGNQLYDPVTVADKAAERAMRLLINQHYPSHNIMGEEEEAYQGESNLTWVLDPIDGTRAFITGLPLWGTLIALNDGKHPVLGVMNQPFTNERYIGTSVLTTCNGIPLHTRPCDSIASATLMCTTPDMFETATQQKAFHTIAAQAQLVRYGGDCYAYCMLASGLVDVIIEANLKSYDVQALIPIIEGAGGIITNWEGKTAQHGGAILACGDPQLHAQLLAVLSPAI